MNTNTNVKQSPKTSSPKIALPSLCLNIAAVQLPDVIETGVSVTSKLKGVSSSRQTKEIPFSAKLSITPSSAKEALCDLGITATPQRAFSLYLTSENKGAKNFLKINFSAPYVKAEEQEFSRDVNYRYIPAGQHTPYGPKDSPGYWETKTEHYKELVNVEKTFTAQDQTVDGKIFKQLYLAILNSDDNAKKEELLSFLHQEFPKESKETHAWISDQLRAKVAEAQARLAKEAQIFEGLSLPSIQ